MDVTSIGNLFKDITTRVLAALIVILHLAGFVYKAIEGNIYLDDSIEYLYMAENIANEGIFYCGDLSKPINPDFFTKRPPLYSLFLTAVHLVFKSDLAVIFVQNLISLFNILLIVIMAVKLGQTSVKIALLLVLLSPVQIIYANMVMSEIILQTWILLMVNSFLIFVKTKKSMNLLWVSVFLILAMLTKPVMYPFALIILLAGLYYFFKDKVKLALVYGLLPLFFIIGYNLWNQKRTGVFHFSSIQTINLVQYNTYFFIKNQFGEQKADEFLKSTYQEANQIENYAERQAFLKRTALDNIKENLPGYLFFHTKGIVKWFVDPGRFDLYNFFGVEAEKYSGYLYQLNREGFRHSVKAFFSQPLWIVLALLSTFVLRLFLAILIPIWFLFGKQSFQEKLAIVIPIVFVASVTGPLGASRFMLPLFPLIILAGSVAFSNIFASNRKVS